MSTGDAVLFSLGFEVLLSYGTMKLKMYCMMAENPRRSVGDSADLFDRDFLVFLPCFFGHRDSDFEHTIFKVGLDLFGVQVTR